MLIPGPDQYWETILWRRLRPKTSWTQIEKEQAGGRLVALTGDGTNDAPMTAQADVGVAIITGNMVDPDSNSTKPIEIVAIGKLALDQTAPRKEEKVGSRSHPARGARQNTPIVSA